jgi:hypothetical protein
VGAKPTARNAILSNMKRCLRMLCSLVTGRNELKLKNYRIVCDIVESDKFFGECDVKDPKIAIRVTPLALCNDYIFKKTLCHEFTHALFSAYGKEEGKEKLKELVLKALDVLEGIDPYNKEASGEEYGASEEMYCFFLENVLSLLLYVASEWDIIRELEYRLYRELLKEGESQCPSAES